MIDIEDIRSRADELGAKFVVTDEEHAERVVQAVDDLHCVEEVFVIGEAAGCTPIDQLMNDDGAGDFIPKNTKKRNYFDLSTSIFTDIDM